MAHDVARSRPLARLVAQAYAKLPTRNPSAPAMSYSPMSDATSAFEFCDTTDFEGIARAVLALLLGGGPRSTPLPDELLGVLGDDVELWCPDLAATGHDEVVDALNQVDRPDDPLVNVTISVDTIDIVPPKVYLEWRLTGRFAQPHFVDDDVLIEPTGRLVETAGVLVLLFQRDRVAAIRCYYDDFALLEQYLAGP